MVTKKIIFIFLLFTIFPSHVISKNFIEIKQYENNIAKNYYNGDYHKLYESIKQLLITYPGHPVSFLYYADLVQMSYIYPPGKIKKILNEMINKIRKDPKIENKNIHLLQLRLELEKLLYSYNWKRAKKISQSLNPLRKWTIIGPFNKYGSGDIKYPFSPEILSEYSNISKSIKKISVYNYDGSVDIEKVLYPDYGIAYAVTSFSVKKSVKIKIYSNSFYKAFINGKQVITNIDENLRNLRIIKVWNTDKISLMIKLDSPGEWKFRVLVTDENDKILKPKLSLKKVYNNDFQFTEEFEYPYELLINETNDKFLTHRRLGIYFNSLNSKEAVFHFEKSLQFNEDPVTSYLLALTMIDLSNDNRSSANYLEGWKIINKLYDKYSDFIPVRHKKLLKLIENRSIVRAFTEGNKLTSENNNHILSYIDFLTFLNYYKYDKEFTECINRFKKKFPDSVYPLISVARFYKSRDKEKFIKICQKILKRKFSKKTVNKLIETYSTRGEYKKAISLINRYNYNDDFTNDLIDIHIKMKNFDKAKKIIFKNIISNEKPSLYYKLGLIDYLKNSDPGMYWEKMLSLDPSLFNFSDYKVYLEKYRMINPFYRYMDIDPLSRFTNKNPHKIYENDEKLKKLINSNSSTVIYRSRIFQLHEKRSSRVFCEDIIYIKNEKGIEKWGEYKIPYRGKFHPIQIRVFHKNGKYIDSYRIQEINNYNYINLSSFKMNCIIHISYIIDDPVDTPGQSNFFSIPFIYLQNYKEPVYKLSIKVISPDDVDVNFFFKDKWNIKTTREHGKKIHSINVKSLAPVYRENFIGSSLNCLPYFSFSTMSSLEDLILWYNGLISDDKKLILKSDVLKLKEKNIMNTVQNVYNFISNSFTLQNNLLYYPGSPDDILYSKSGTPEDKVILAKKILKELGIKSYMAFAKNKRMPDFKDYVSPKIFTHVLLYIPIDINNSLWLDFSNQYCTFGTINPDISDTEALIIIENKYVIKNITGSERHRKKSNFWIDIDTAGNAKFRFKTSFFGTYGKYRNQFKHKLYYENTINSYYSGLIPSLSIDTYTVENLTNYEKPLTINASGSGLGLSIIGADKLFLQPILNKSKIYKYINYPERKYTLIISSPVDETEEYNYILPSLYSNYEIKKDYKLNSKFGYAAIKIHKTSGSNELIVKKNIKITKIKIHPDEYKDFIKFCMNLKKIEYQNLTIRKK